MLRIKIDIPKDNALIAIAWTLCEKKQEITNYKIFREAIRLYAMKFGNGSLTEHKRFYKLFMAPAEEIVYRYYNV